MRYSHLGLAVRSLSFCGVILVLATSSYAQTLGPGGINAGGMGGEAQSVAGQEQDMRALVDAQRQNNEDPLETAAYKDFYNASEPAKKIQLGTKFLQKYPKSYLDEPVDVGLLDAYYAQRDWKNVYAMADNALNLKPDDVYVLTTVGWLIPHVYSPSDPDAGKLLDRAEQYSKYAIDVIPKMPKPAHMDDKQFAAMKDQTTRKAESALGLVYFRRNYYDLSAKELQDATTGLATPDQTDLFILAMDLDNLKRPSDAVAVYNHCAQMTGPFQDRCKQAADAVKSEAAPSK
ncbi:MAG TPA: hypothetical protein VMB02_15580 [Candidatus Aquilonibacter sp.]|nr:hypothetical protein [Candidatus Aquilonibacter sp.]